MLSRLEEARSLDGVTDKLQAAVSAVVKPRWLRDLLHGTPQGHPLHPVLVQVPVGAFISAAVLDLVPGGHRSATTLIGVGTASVAPAVAAGLVDWSELTRDRQRLGLVHATVNVVGVSFYAASLVARLRGGSGRALSFAGLTVISLGAHLGGHLSYALGGGVSHAATEMPRVPDDWTSVGELSTLPERKPAVRTVGDVPVLLYRDGQTVTAMVERCGHEGGPLGEGAVEEDCVVCPWHGSTFRLRDGVVVHGPAAADQPLLRVRVRDGAVEVAHP
ncbi:Rieske 2Fe-2S domain-containing protein [Actinoplanes solisilvae]|uniref:Rieske 2Fe-2S domain-containing protein n=1 Tax=Actinoplanes solisilvae TaxID=2486853 RepID=UPI0032C482EF